MFKGLLKQLVGSKNDRELKKLQPLVDEINDLETEISQLSLEALRAKTDEFKSRIQQATHDIRTQSEEAQSNEGPRRQSGMGD